METKTLNEVRILGFERLVNNLGPADAIRFIQSYSHGGGDYTKSRKDWLETDFDTVVAGIMEKRKKTNRDLNLVLLDILPRMDIFR